MKYFILLGLLTSHPDKFTQDKDLQRDWEVLTITKICSVNGKQCFDKLNINKDLKVSYGLYGEVSHEITIENEFLHKITNINKSKVNRWDKEYLIDSVCGYTIELNNSKKYSIFFDVDTGNYDLQDIKNYIATLNDIFRRI